MYTGRLYELNRPLGCQGKGRLLPSRVDGGGGGDGGVEDANSGDDYC